MDASAQSRALILIPTCVISLLLSHSIFYHDIYDTGTGDLRMGKENRAAIAKGLSPYLRTRVPDPTETVLLTHIILSFRVTGTD